MWVIFLTKLSRHIYTIRVFKNFLDFLRDYRIL